MPALDLLILNAQILDGTGTPACFGWLGVHGGKIAAMGEGHPPGDLLAAERCDAQGLTLAPGFVDVHGHSEYHLLADPSGASKVLQGVTTEVAGNCGYGAAPLLGREWEERRNDYSTHLGIDTPFRTVAEYGSHLESLRPAMNLALLVGHGSLRASVMGRDDRPPTHEELHTMERLLIEALDQGAVGLSLGLIYAPGLYAHREELVALARCLRGRGVLTAHMRSESDALIEAIDEVIAVAAQAGCPLQISHLKTCRPHNWHKMATALERVKQSRLQGVAVHIDRYPYTASNTTAMVMLPDWANAGTKEEKLARLRDASARNRMREELAPKGDDYWAAVVIADLVTEQNRPFIGMRLPEAAASRGQAPLDFLIDLLIEEGTFIAIFLFTMSEENLRLVLQSPHAFVASDAATRPIVPEGPLGRGRPHPRAFGTFPRVLGKLVREEQWFTLEEAVAKMSHRPASAFGLHDRGRLAVGLRADLVLFDPDAVADRSDFSDPFQAPVGIEGVWIGGERVAQEGRMTEARPGRFAQAIAWT